jgi:excisionase family DNA binding protein
MENERMEANRAGMLPVVLDTAGVAELLGLSPRTVLLMARDGRLPARRVPGGRKYQFLTDEILDALAPDGSVRPNLAAPHSPIPSQRPPDDADPCDIWGAAPAPRGPGWALDCLRHWLSLAGDAGLEVSCITPPSPESRGPRVGVVSVDGLTYRVLAGPRKRIRLVDDDGDMRWELVDSVWVEPVADQDE